MTVYIIARMTIHDRDEYNKYDAGFMEVFNQYDGTLLSVDEDPKVLEGTFSPTRSILISFPSEEAAMAWMKSDGYQAIVGHRLNASEGEVILAKGFNGAP